MDGAIPGGDFLAVELNDSKTMSIAPSFKEEARRIIEELPDDASWEDLIDALALVVKRAKRARKTRRP